MKNQLLFFLTLFYTLNTMGQKSVEFTINVDKARKPISQDIYGTNTYEALSTDPLNPTVARFGGNRSSTYNWETNWSNAGSDYIHHSDDWWVTATGLDKLKWETVAGSAIQAQIDSARKANRAYVLTLQAMGYVAADENGTVDCSAPCNRWVPSFPNKPGGIYQYPPDTKDNAVYIDEEVSWLTKKYGLAKNGGVKYYQVDNEPELWNHTHSFVKQEKVTPLQLAEINETYAKVVRKFDPTAKILGFVGFGWWGIVTVDFRTYLKEMKKRSEIHGASLIDIFDWHFYPNDLQKFTSSQEWDLLQAPRVLWDDTYYIAGGSGPMGYYGKAPSLIRRYKNAINVDFPGLKMGITEWNASFDVSKVVSGLYVADILGVFGQEDIEVATYFDRPSKFAATGFKLFTNYDGKNSRYGNTYVEALTSDLPNATVYASIENSINDTMLHVVVVSKNMDGGISGTFKINGSKQYDKTEGYYFDSSSEEIKKAEDITEISQNSFRYQLPKHSAVHFVLSSSNVTSTKKSLPYSLTLYPKPFENTLKIDAKNEFTAIIYSLHGEKVEEGHFSSHAEMEKNLISGSYVVKIIIKGEVFVEKISKL